jgi:hypothetical protein
MSLPPQPEIRRLPAANGMAWLVQSMSLLRLQAGRLLLIALLMQLVLGLTQLPLFGLLVILSVPALNAGLLEAFHRTAQGRQPEIRTLFMPLASGVHSGRLLAMGALVFAVGIVSMSLLLSGNSDLLDPALLERIEQGDLDAIASLNQQALFQMVLAFLLGISISGTLSYMAIPLLWFHRARLWGSLVSGLRALVVNWKPFLVLGLGLLVVFLPVAIVSGALFSMVGAGGLLSAIVLGLIMVLLLLFQLLLFGTQYCAFRDIFGLVAEEAPAPGHEGQLVA